MIKQQLRKIYKQQRQSISSKEKLKLDDLLLIQFQRLSFENISTLLTYWPMPHQSEPNTHLFSSYLRYIIPGLNIAYPVCDFTSIEISAVLIDEETVYQHNAFGIAEPKEGIILPPEEIDLIFVPLLVCDKQGYRVGFGKGFYDRYLPKCRDNVLKTGFSYFAPIDKIDDTNPFDVPLDICITPEEVYEF